MGCCLGRTKVSLYSPSSYKDQKWPRSSSSNDFFCSLELGQRNLQTWDTTHMLLHGNDILSFHRFWKVSASGNIYCIQLRVVIKALFDYSESRQKKMQPAVVRRILVLAPGSTTFSRMYKQRYVRKFRGVKEWSVLRCTCCTTRSKIPWTLNPSSSWFMMNCLGGGKLPSLAAVEERCYYCYYYR